MNLYDGYLLNVAKRIPPRHLSCGLWGLENFEILISKFTIDGPDFPTEDEREDEIWSALLLMLLACLFNSPDLVDNLKTEFLEKYGFNLKALKEAILTIAQDHGTEIVDRVRMTLHAIGDTPYRVDNGMVKHNWILGVISKVSVLNLKEITIPNEAETTEDLAFLHAKNLTSVEFKSGSNLYSTGHGAFESCTALETITFPDGFRRLGGKTFYNDTNLKYVSLPKSLVKIGPGAFDGCRNLKTIDFRGDKVVWDIVSKDDDWDRDLPNDYQIHCTDGIWGK